MNNLLVILLMILPLAISAQNEGAAGQYAQLLESAFQKAGENVTELKKAMDSVDNSHKEGMAFLIAYMPERDLTSLTADFLLENVEYAYMVRERYDWCRELPDSIFLNEVLPYANISEERHAWRKEFYRLFSPLADSSAHMVDAIFNVCGTIQEITGVEYNTNRSKVDLSPLESMAEKMATCTGLSILLTDAFRSVGIPSRLAGTPMWTNYRGNHTWSEVWIDGEWHFIEYYPDSLDRSWFLADAGKADPENMLHWIYAVSYKPTGLPFYAVNNVRYLKGKADLSGLPKPIREYWDEEDEALDRDAPYIHGVNVTSRYRALYEKTLMEDPLGPDATMAEIVVYKSKETNRADARLGGRVEVFQDGKLIDFGYTPGEKDDLNKFLRIRLKKNSEYELRIYNSSMEPVMSRMISTSEEELTTFRIFLSDK